MELTLYADASWQSPWVFHVMVALEELGLQYKLETRKIPLSVDERHRLQERGVLGKVPRLLPASLEDRARARQVMSWLRTSLTALREDRPTASIFQRTVTKPMSEKGRHDVAELVRVAERLIAPDKLTLFDDWSLADTDLALALMRLMATSDTSLSKRLIDYCLAQWGRASVRKYLAYIPSTP